MSPIFGVVRQLGFISRDFDRSIHHFLQNWGIGPWYVLRDVTNRMLYDGVEVSLDMSIAMANSGDLQFEIVTQHNQARSMYTDALARTPELHLQHLAVWATDVRAVELASHSHNWRTIFETCSGPGRSVFVSHPHAPLTCVEISDCDPFKDRVRAAVRQAGVDWDGTDPIREGLPS